MKRAERLFQILNVLRNRRTAITADQLADILETSKRTIYRDVQSLILSGVPIEGEAGVGYILHRHFDLPPLMFDVQELEALLLGIKMVRVWSDKQLAAGANSALQKILAVVPPPLREREHEFSIFVPEFAATENLSAYSEVIRPAISELKILAIIYTREDGETSNRRIHPLGLFFWGKVWTLVAWCEMRQDYRTFRLDRIKDLIETGDNFVVNDGKSMDHYLARERKRYEDSVS
jgi:predicted DNA-binding transcriptional regulator YafY